MRVLLAVLAVLAVLSGLGVLTGAKSAVHEIEGFILFLIGAVCLTGAGIIESVSRLRKDVLTQNTHRP